MRILAIGGTGFIGQPVVRQLLAAGHRVTIFHRGTAKVLLPGAEEIVGDRNHLADFTSRFSSLKFDVVLDFLLSDGRQAQELMQVFRGIAGRVVAISSCDVYRAYGLILGNEPGALQPVPITEDSQLRTAKPYSEPHLRFAQTIFPWVTDDYDKVTVEHAVMSTCGLPATVLRLPMVYGPGDPLHRFFPVVKRVDDGRQVLLVQGDVGRMHPPRGHVANVAAAIALATVSDRAAGRIYNIGEDDAPDEVEWTGSIARAAGFAGRVAVLPRNAMPGHLISPLNATQDWLVTSRRIREELGFEEPIAREECLASTVAWERAHPPEKINAAQFDYAAEDAALRASFTGAE